MKVFKFFIICISVSCLIFLYNDRQDALARADEKKEAKAEGASDPLQEKILLRIDPVKYTAKSRRDPFVSIITLAKKKMEVKKKNTNPLENYDVMDFKIMGVIYDGKKYYASVVLPDKKAYTLTKGMKVGLFGGKIEDITSNKIIVKEFVIDFMGQRKPKYTEIKLREEEVR
jgi:Tfp pilus assembly protein PilP